MNPQNYVYLSALLFTIGAAGVLLRRNAIVMFMCVELMLNAVNLAFVTFARLHGHLDGQMVAFFTMVVAACEVVVGLAIIMTIFRARKSASVADANLLKGWGEHTSDLAARRVARGRCRDIAGRRPADRRLGAPAGMRDSTCLVRRRRDAAVRPAQSARRRPDHHPEPVHLDSGRQPAGRLRTANRPVVNLFRAVDHRRRIADPHLLDRVYGRRP